LKHIEDSTTDLERFQTGEQAQGEFQHSAPARFNIADAVCSKHTDGATRVALIEVKAAANNTYTFGAINFLSDKFANVLSDCAVALGDRVAVVLEQSAALPIAHLGALKCGAVVVPLSTRLDSEALRQAIIKTNPKAIIINSSSLNKLDESIGIAQGLEAVFLVTDKSRDCDPGRTVKDFWKEIGSASSDFTTVETERATPAFIFNTTGFADESETIEINHGYLIGQLAAFEMHNKLEFDTDPVCRTPMDWATHSALFEMLYPAWFYGLTVEARDD
jgi:acetyl-CoA synthetase